MKSNNKPLASISLDLDNQWSYMKIHGDKGWEKYPSYFDIFIPHVLDILEELDLKITFFIVGKDAEIVTNRKYLKMIAERGHEVGNHSYNHESWLQFYSYEEVEREIRYAEEIIEEVTGQKPRGFRGPGFCWSLDTLMVLESRGYLYDASTFPTYIGPLARMYYFWKSNLTKEERRARKLLFGGFSEGFRKLKPYNWKLSDGKQLLELPVTTIPGLKIPFHLSYLMYLGNISFQLMKLYMKFAVVMCRMSRTPVSYLLHPLDIIGGDQISQLAFFPGMDMPTEKKIMIFRYTLKKLSEEFQLIRLKDFAEINTKSRYL